MDSVLWIGGGVAILVLLAAVVLWNNALMRGYQSRGAALLARSPVSLIVCGVLLAAVVAVPGIVSIDSDSISLVLLPALFLALFAIMFATYYVPFWAADSVGLTRRALFLGKTLSWQDIDWVYGSVKRTNYRLYGVVKVGQSTQQELVVEAGPKRKIKVMMKAFLSGGNPQPLMRAIEQHATSAQFGFDKFAAVKQRRAASAPAGRR